LSPQGKCHICKNPEHWKRECPDIRKLLKLPAYIVDRRDTGGEIVPRAKRMSVQTLLRWCPRNEEALEYSWHPLLLSTSTGLSQGFD
jgi:hypothetical protein